MTSNRTPKTTKTVRKGGDGNASPISPTTTPTPTRTTEKYQKKTQREHLLDRPGMYMGNIYNTKDTLFLLDHQQKMVLETIEYNPGIVKMFDEIIMNAVDHAREYTSVTRIEVAITDDTIQVFNNGPGIDIELHKEGVYIPELIFSQFLTSSNFDDNQKRLKAGMNGLGAKVVSTFSDYFLVETVSKHTKYTQVFENNLTKIGQPVIEPTSDPEGTTIVFKPDLKRFKTKSITPGTQRVLLKRMYDVAAWTPESVKVYLNTTQIGITNFVDYVKLFLNSDQEKELVVVKSGTYNIALCSNVDETFQQVSFVNGVATSMGGTHVNAVLNNPLKKVAEKVSFGSSTRTRIRDQLFVFVFALIENPEFKSQVKEELTTKLPPFPWPENALKKVVQMQFMRRLQDLVRLKESRALTASDGKKKLRVLDVPNLDDANRAGGKESKKCTLILTEGLSAKTFATAGISLLGRDYFGIFPLRGKLLNVRNATNKQIEKNEEIKNLKKILGLQQNKKSINDLQRSMRYGRVCILTDADTDGMHIQGLLINFFHHFWPALITDHQFIVRLNTPVVKAIKGNKIHKFHTLVHFQQWYNKTTNANQFKIKYYKGLGTSTSKEAKESFEDFERQLVTYSKAKPEDVKYIHLAFQTDQVDARKQWIRESTGRDDLITEKSFGDLSLREFFEKEFVHFSIYDNRRSIPNMMDGLKPSQRKVLYGVLKKNTHQELKVHQIAGFISEQTLYAHGDTSLNETIISMNHDYVGTNNVNVLIPCGSFGTRIHGGKDAASPRYISTKINPLVEYIYRKEDSLVLTHLEENGVYVEPEYYLPIIPMILVNGSCGIGTGFATDVPCYNCVQIIKYLLRLVTDTPPAAGSSVIVPWFRGFKGTVELNSLNSYTTHGKWSRPQGSMLVIEELPIRVWTQNYKHFLNTLVEQQVIENYNDLTTETQIRFEIHAPRLQIDEWVHHGEIEKIFKLKSSHKINLFAFDHQNKLQKYDTPEHLLKCFYQVRLQFYEKRRVVLLNAIKKEHRQVSLKHQFIQLVIQESVVIFKRDHSDILQQLQANAFPCENENELKQLLEIKLSQFTATHLSNLQDKIVKLQHDIDFYTNTTNKQLWKLDLEQLLTKCAELDSSS
jgi:DNA topoisomerase-2